MINIFEFENYKEYLKALEGLRKPIQRGFRSRIAETLSCQNAYVSHILNTDANFSLEQALKIAEFLSLAEEETKYFILLIELARAGTKDLQRFFQKALSDFRSLHLDLSHRVGKFEELSAENQAIYYSSWLYPSVHIIVTIAGHSNVQQISKSLNIEEKAVREIVHFLLSVDLLSENQGKLETGRAQLHLKKNSPYIRQHHANWRTAALQSLNFFKENDLHYSTVSSLSKTDAEALHAKFVKVIQEYVETVKPSKEEVLYNFNLDFYSLLS